jgi:spore germination protein (amino acid permease)
MTKIQISRTQYFLIIPNLLFAKAIGITAGVTARKVGGDTWTAMTIGFVIGIAVIMVITYLSSKFPEQTLIRLSEKILGKWIGIFIGLIMTLFFAVAFAASANVMTMHLKEYFLLETPFWVICFIYTLLCMYGVFLGIENIIRFSLIGFLGILAINITMIFGTINDFELINVLPLFDRGFTANITNSIYVFSDLAMAVFGIGMIYPMIDKKEKIASITFWSLIMCMGLILIWPLFELGVMGAGAMKQYVVVCMQQVRCAQLTRYFPRFELIMVAFFTFCTFVQSATMFYCSVYSLKQVTEIKKDWYIILPLTGILFLMTYFMANDHNNYIRFLTYPWAQICTVLSIGLPLVLLAAMLIRKKAGNVKN